MTVAASSLRAKPAFATTVDSGQALVARGPLRRAAGVVGDVLVGLGIVFSVPFVILAIGTPIALCVRFLLWIAGAL